MREGRVIFANISVIVAHPSWANADIEDKDLLIKYQDDMPTLRDFNARVYCNNTKKEMVTINLEWEL